MQTCKHEDIKKTKKAKGKKHYMKLGLNPGLWNQSLGLLPTKLSQDLANIKNQRVYSILKKKKRLTMRTIHRSCHRCSFPKPPPPLLQATAVTPPGRKPIFPIPSRATSGPSLRPRLALGPAPNGVSPLRRIAHGYICGHGQHPSLPPATGGHGPHAFSDTGHTCGVAHLVHVVHDRTHDAVHPLDNLYDSRKGCSPCPATHTPFCPRLRGGALGSNGTIPSPHRHALRIGRQRQSGSARVPAQ